MKQKLHLKSNADLLGQSVSEYSLWHDPQWVFDNPTAGQRASGSTISWNIYLPDQSYLTDLKWAGLLDSFRRLIWSLYTSPRNGKHYKPGMAIDFQRQVSYFSRWMVANSYHSFSELDSEAFDEYAECVYEDRSSDSEAPPTAALLMKYLRLPTLIWIQSTELKLAGIAPPLSGPFGGSSAYAVAKKLATDRRGQIAPISDDVFIKIMMSALSVIDDIDDIADVVDLMVEMSIKAAALPERRRSKIMEAFQQEVAKTYPRAVPYVQANAIWSIWGAIALAREAASIIVQGSVGLRGSEFCGLVANPVIDGLPACVSVRSSVSGLDEIFFIRGRVYKGEHGWAEHEWVAGTRPIGTSQVPPPIRAVLALEKLFRRFRGSHNFDRLALYTTQLQGYATRDVILSPVTTEFMRRSQKIFIEKHVGIENCDITPSQWRKTFAQFVVRTDSKTPPALRDHFHHVNLTITEVGYGGADPEYRQVLDDAAVQNSIDFLGALVSGRTVAVGTMADTVRASAAMLKTRLSNRHDDDMSSDIEDIVLETGIRVHELRFDGSPAGNCVYRPGTGRCTEGCIARWVMPGPLWSAARPDVCWDCCNVVFSPHHVEFWQARWNRHDETYTHALANGDAALAGLARTRMAQCAAVLSRLGVRIMIRGRR